MISTGTSWSKVTSFSTGFTTSRSLGTTVVFECDHVHADATELIPWCVAGLLYFFGGSG